MALGPKAAITSTSAVVVGSLVPANATDFIGRASVIDGDTIEIHGQRIRLRASTRQNRIRSAEAMIASCTDAARRRPLPWRHCSTPFLVPSYALRPGKISIDALSLCAIRVRVVCR
jgi:hypothetical protein